MIYIDYDSCYRNCYKGVCEIIYDSLVNQIEYTCKSKSYNYSLFWWFMLIPLLGPVIATLLFCCCFGKDEQEEYKVKVQVETEEALVPAQNQHQNTVPTNTAKVSPNVTGVTPYGQQVTLSNGQAGIFVPQFYQPQPIYQQQQMYKMQEMHNEHTVQMPNLM
ncbi:Hypothetical_protein [Hexamita inflata]|uniref:Hypothetical_protein n=1 Tax=Hexamita inflata TaxID=28002 RepID=A0AA86TF89_9EUKA|nr:Hypothetical protein HINF_LOCUS4649 [Hexamita inflata]CAI9969626.1 Hypothetical protein HINF_LOCUS57271 [Hexamita inflata]